MNPTLQKLTGTIDEDVGEGGLKILGRATRTLQDTQSFMGSMEASFRRASPLWGSISPCLEHVVKTIFFEVSKALTWI